ncbi:MAG: aminotransferase class I/II-fold pyridoxal phosphate-dependent enzyme [Chloroflexota bacterium]|nr:MAG: aminotransferase class I/II-fold pyridoxal phosphate-dependent enzyme [Chloroflexota bacterium]
MAEKERKRGIYTDLVHAGDAYNPSPGVASPIYQSATFRFERPEEIAEAMAAEAHPQFYGRYATPNTKQVEATVARLERSEAALAVASGMAAVSLVLLTFLVRGDHVIAQRTLYPTTSKLIEKKLPSFGIEVTIVDQENPEEFEAAIRPNTKLIYVESPANPTLSLTDLAAIADLAKNRGLITVADNTFATPVNQRPLTLGIDLVLHSATKYLAGHSDVVAGIVAGDENRIGQLWHNHVMLGGVLHPFDAWLVQRGLRTLAMRMARHNENAMKVSRFLADHPAVREVYYPGLEMHKQHELARKQMPGGFGGMVCFDLAGRFDAGYGMMKRVELITLAVSLGGVHSLVTHPASTISIVQSEAEILASGVRPGLVRLSVGVEDSADIIADLRQALE